MHRFPPKVILPLFLLALLVGSILAAPMVSAQVPVPQADVRITISETYLARLLSTQLSSAMQDQEMQVQEPRVDLKANRQIDLTVQAEAPVLGEVEPTLSITLAVEENQLDLTVDNVSLGGANVPSALIQEQIQPIEQMAEQQANQLLTQLADQALLELVDLRTTENILILRFRAVDAE